MEPAPHLLVVIGPSGSGKSTVVRTLADRGVVRVHPTWTTRPRRPDEIEGSPEHVFVSAGEFGALERSGFFVDTVSMFGLPFRYGLPPIERPHPTDRLVDTVMLRAPLVGRFARTYPHFVVFQIEDTPARTEARLRDRGGSKAELLARLVDNERERVAGREIAHRVFVNDSTPDALADAITVAIADHIQTSAA